MALTIGLEPARDALAGSVTAFVETVGSASEWDLLGASRCHGWARTDVVTHLREGWQELLGGLFARTDAPVTVDAASYWTAYDADHTDRDPVVSTMAQRRRGSAYLRPESVRTQLRDVADGLLAGLAALGPADDAHHRFQGYVLTTGDLLASWAVETVVHHLDLLLPQEPPAAGLRVARDTIEALAGPLPETWTDRDAVLVGAGRSAAPDDLDPGLRSRLPALG